MRLFTAVYPPAEVLESLAERIPPGLDHSPLRQWHITLGFHPDAPVHRIEALEDELAAIALKPFELRLAGTGRWGAVSWVGVAGEVAQLHELARLARRGAATAGVSTDQQDYLPHLTIARDDGLLADSLYGWESEPWLVEDFQLVRSSAGSGRGRVEHEVTASWDLLVD